MEDLVRLVPLIPMVPLLTFALIAIYVRRYHKLSGYLAVAAIFIAWVLSMVIVVSAVARMPHFAEEPAVHLTLLSIPTGATALDIGVQIDPLTVALLFMVPTVCLMIFIYSTGYMKGDPRYSRFFAYICLFATGMLGEYPSQGFPQVRWMQFRLVQADQGGAGPPEQALGSLVDLGDATGGRIGEEDGVKGALEDGFAALLGGA